MKVFVELLFLHYSSSFELINIGFELFFVLVGKIGADFVLPTQCSIKYRYET
jgi:hypothetical protein